MSLSVKSQLSSVRCHIPISFRPLFVKVVSFSKGGGTPNSKVLPIFAHTWCVSTSASVLARSKPQKPSAQLTVMPAPQTQRLSGGHFHGVPKEKPGSRRSQPSTASIAPPEPPLVFLSLSPKCLSRSPRIKSYWDCCSPSRSLASHRAVPRRASRRVSK